MCVPHHVYHCFVCAGTERDHNQEALSQAGHPEMAIQITVPVSIVSRKFALSRWSQVYMHGTNFSPRAAHHEYSAARNPCHLPTLIGPPRLLPHPHATQNRQAKTSDLPHVLLPIVLHSNHHLPPALSTTSGTVPTMTRMDVG